MFHTVPHNVTKLGARHYSLTLNYNVNVKAHSPRPSIGIFNPLERVTVGQHGMSLTEAIDCLIINNRVTVLVR